LKSLKKSAVSAKSAGETTFETPSHFVCKTFKMIGLLRREQYAGSA